MKSILSLILLFITFNVVSQNISLSEKYENDEFLVLYPKGWRVDTESAFHVLVLYPPSLGDEYETSVNFFVMGEEQAITDIEKYSRQAKGLLEIRADVQSSSVLDSKNGKCIRFDYKMDFYDSKLIGIQYRYIDDATVYSLSFSGEEKSYLFYKDVAEEVMKSFRFK
jgi:hypothetical protein